MKRATASILCLIYVVGLVQSYPVQEVSDDKQFSIKLHSVKTQKLGTYEQPETCYFGKIEIGSAKQEFDVLFDLSFDDILIPNSEDYLPSPYLHHHNGFKVKKSHSCSCTQTTSPLSYNGGQFGMTMCTDFIAMKTILGANEVNFTTSFTLADHKHSTIDLSDLEVDGFFGLSPREHNKKGIATPIQSMLTKGTFQNATFSIYINGKDNDGEITFGGVKHGLISGEMSWFQSISSDVWAVTMKPVLFGSKVVSCADRYCRAVLSSSVSDFYGPPADVYKIYNLFGVTEKNGMPLVNQSIIADAPNITFVIGKKQYSVTPESYISKYSGGHYLNIFPIKHGDFKSEWILGTNFMSTYYTAYDLDKLQIGIAHMASTKKYNIIGTP